MKELINKVQKMVSHLNGDGTLESLNIDDYNQYFSNSDIEIQTQNKNSKIQKAWSSSILDYDVFNYTTVLIYIENGEYKFLIDDETKRNQIIETIKSDHLKYITRKHPSIYKAMNKKKYLPYTIEFLDAFIKDITDNKFLFSMTNLFKNLETDVKYNPNKVIENYYHYNLNDLNENKTYMQLFFHLTSDERRSEPEHFSKILKIFKDIETQNNIPNIIEKYSPEKIGDIISLRKMEHQYNLILSSKLTEKNKTLFDNDSLFLLKELTKEGLTAKNFHKDFAKKISKFKDQKSLHDGLTLFSLRFRGWEKTLYTEKIEKYGSTYRETNDNKIIVQIDDYNTSSKLGASSWCISTDEYWFDDYTDNYQRQYFVFDFNKEANDPNSMIGITVNYQGNICNAHNKNDMDIMDNLIDSGYDYGFSALSNDMLSSKIDKKYKSSLNKLPDLIKYDVLGEHYQTCYSNSILEFKHANINDRADKLFSIISEIDCNVNKNKFLINFYRDTDGEKLFSIKDSVSFAVYHPTPFIFEYILGEMKNKNTEELFAFHSEFFDRLDKDIIKKINNQTDGLTDFVFGVVESMEQHSLNLLSSDCISDLAYNSEYHIGHAHEIRSSRAINFINFFSKEENFNQIKDNENCFSKVEHISLYKSIFSNVNNKLDDGFISTVDKQLDPGMRRSLINNLLDNFDSDTLSKLDIRTTYEKNIFKSCRNNSDFFELNDWLHDYQDNKYETEIYQDLFNYAKLNSKQLILKDTRILADNPKLRTRLLQDNLIDNENYLIAVRDSFCSNPFFDKEALKKSIQTIKKELLIDNFESEFYENEAFFGELFEHIVYQDIITAESLKTKLGNSFTHLNVDTQDWFTEEIKFEKEHNKSKNINKKSKQK